MDATVKQAIIWVVATVVVLSVVMVVSHQLKLYTLHQAMAAISSPFQELQDRQAEQQSLARRERLEAEAAARVRLEAQDAMERRQREFERAFLESYQEPDGCDRFESERAMVDCVNHRMRARQVFHEEFFGEPASTELDAGR